MRSPTRLTAVVLGLGLAVSACAGAEEAPAAADPSTTPAAAQEPTTEATDEGHDAHGDHSDHGGAEVAEGPVTASVLGTSTGTYGPMGEGLGSASSTLVVEGTVTMVKSESGTEIETDAGGLVFGETFPAHLHDGSCTEFGGHYMHDHSGPAAPPNELWLSTTGDPQAPLKPSDRGRATGSGSADWVPREVPLSMMIHDSQLPGLPIACADFAAYDGAATLVLEAVEDGVEAVEYSLDGGDWLTYDGAVELTEPGTYTVAFAGVDAEGERGEEQEISFTVAGAR